MEFLSPVHYGDHVDIDVTIERVGRSSVQIRYEATVAGKPVFKARTIAVVVDMRTFRPTPLPQALRESFLSARDPKQAESEADAPPS